MGVQLRNQKDRDHGNDVCKINHEAMVLSKDGFG